MLFLGLYRDPVVAQVTRCDWRIRDPVEDSRPATLYLVVPPSDVSRTKPLVRLILNQIGRRLTEQLHAKGRRHRPLLVLDEFPALGHLDFFESALASWQATVSKALIAQSLNQIEKAYGSEQRHPTTAMRRSVLRRTTSVLPSAYPMRLPRQPNCVP
jgi:type IV secretion system protein VirD4